MYAYVFILLPVIIIYAYVLFLLGIEAFDLSFDIIPFAFK